MRITFLWLTMLAAYTAISAPQVFANNPVQVSFINPDSKGNPFWDRTTEFMRWFAEDLNIELEVLYARENRFNVANLAEQVMRRESPPDYLVFIYQHGSGKAILEMAERYRQKSLIFNTAIHPQEEQYVGQPREHFKYWLGHLKPDDRYAGKLLAEQLLSQARARTAERQVRTLEMIAISGGKESTPALDRNRGLADALATNLHLKLNQLVFARWEPATAARQANTLLTRYPETAMIWSASDAMALAIGNSLRTRKGGRPLPLIGGIDWTPEAFDAIRQGRLAVSIGGHFLDGGWALVWVHDHYHGRDFADSGTTVNTKMVHATRDNLHHYAMLWDAEKARAVDYSRFSRALNSRWTAYRFSAEAVVTMIQKPNTEPAERPPTTQ